MPVKSAVWMKVSSFDDDGRFYLENVKGNIDFIMIYATDRFILKNSDTPTR